MKEVPLEGITEAQFHQIRRESGQRNFKFARLTEPPVIRIADSVENHVDLVNGVDRRRIGDAGFLNIETDVDPSYSGPTVFFFGRSSSLREVIPANGRTNTRTLFRSHNWIEVND